MDNPYLQKYEEYKQAYYGGNPLISDEEFDAYENKLISMGLIKCATVGSVMPNNKNKVKHPIAMLSLAKDQINPEKSVNDLLYKSTNKNLMVTLKLDGNSLGLVYEDGKLTMIKTRGDGEYGFNVSNRLQHMSYLPSEICAFRNIPYIEVRGELLITNENFDLLTKDMIKRGDEKPKSQRNIVAGLLNPTRQSNLDLIKYCSFYAHGVDDIEVLSKLGVYYEHQLFEMFATNGLNVPYFNNFRLAKNSEDVSEITLCYKQMLEEGNLDILTDGLVFTIEEIGQQIHIGCNNHEPKYKIAYKLKAVIKSTTVLDFKYDIGKSGKLTIVAIVEPVEVSGATITKVTMHNPKYLLDHKIAIGSMINIMRSGEVIPKFINVIYSPDDAVVEVPTTCPSCNSNLTWSSTGVDLLCINEDCRVMNIRKLLSWATILEIEGLSIKTIEMLYDMDIIKTVKDIYEISRYKNKIINTKGYGLGKYTNLINEINNKKTISFDKIINGTNLRGIGKTVSTKLNSMISNIEDFKNIKFSDIFNLEKYGEVVSTEIINGKQKIVDNYELLSSVEGVVIVFGKNLVKESVNIISGKSYTFVITGTLLKPRKEIENNITNKGHKLNSSMSRNVDYLVCNEESNSSKYKDAKKLNIPIINEDELYEILGV